MGVDAYGACGLALPLRWQALGAVCLAGFVCSVFTSVASAFLLLSYGLVPGLRGEVPYWGLWLRVVFFGAFAGLALAGLQRCRGPHGVEEASQVARGATWRTRGALAVVLIFAAGLVLPHLDVYPWAAPDEMHHLIVAKNLSVYGRYASGSPAIGFKDFDPYDSVGAPVIVPVSLGFRFWGVSVVAARRVMALYFLLFCGALYVFLAPLMGAAAAVAGVFLSACAFSSIYLGRTLYGEVPALFYFLMGLSLWRCALRRGGGWLPGLVAGLAFGVAVLCKTILVLSAFSFLGVWVYDRLTRRRIRLPHVLAPLAGGFCALGVWWGYESLSHGDLGASAGSTVGLYQHYLLVGLEPVWKNLSSTVLAYPLAHAVAAAGLVVAIPRCFGRRYDPAGMVLLLVAVFYGYWWLCFTPGQLPRYLWSSYAVSAAFAGLLLWRAWSLARERGRRVAVRIGAVVAGCLVVLPALLWVSGQAREVYTNREMASATSVGALVGALPADVRVATAFGPMRETLSFLTGKRVAVGEEVGLLLKEHDVVIALTPLELGLEAWPGLHRRFYGRYAVLSRGPLPEQP